MTLVSTFTIPGYFFADSDEFIASGFVWMVIVINIHTNIDAFSEVWRFLQLKYSPFSGGTGIS